MDILIKLPIILQYKIYKKLHILYYSHSLYEIKNNRYTLKSPFECIGIGDKYEKDRFITFDKCKYYTNLDFMYTLIFTSKKYKSSIGNVNYISYSFRHKPNSIIERENIELYDTYEFIRNNKIINNIVHTTQDVHNKYLPELNNFQWS